MYWKASRTFILALSLCQGLCSLLYADGEPPEERIYQTAQAAFTPFTGKVTRERVRLRTQPNQDGTIIQEMNRGDMLVVTDDADDYYAVQPPAGIKAFIYRTYVLDGSTLSDSGFGYRVNEIQRTLPSPVFRS